MFHGLLGFERRLEILLVVMILLQVGLVWVNGGFFAAGNAFVAAMLGVSLGQMYSLSRGTSLE